MLYNVDFAIAGLIIYIVLYLSMKFQFDIDTKSNRLFRLVVVSAFLADLLDIVTAYTISYPQLIPVWANYALNIIFFLTAEGCVFFLPGYIRYLIDPDNNKADIGDRINQGVLILYTLVVVTTPLTHLVIFFDDNRTYTYGPLHFILFVGPAYYLLFSLGRIIKNKNKFAPKQIRTIVLFIVTATAGILIQLLFLDHTLFHTSVSALPA